MARQKLTVYRRAQRPAIPESLPLYLDNELRRLEIALKSAQDAILQIQTATALPIPP